MKHIYFALLLFLLLNTENAALAQITITESYFQDRLGMTENTTIYGFDNSLDVTAIINATGPNQSWDFSGFAIIDTARVSDTYIELPADVPGYDLFPDSDFAIKVTSDTVSTLAGVDFDFFLFHSMEDGFVQGNGWINMLDLDMDGEVDSLIAAFTPPSRVSPMQLAYEAAWEDSTATILTSFGQTLPASYAQVKRSEVDGWGTLVTPAGSFQALRITTAFYERNLASSGVTPTHTDIEFISNEGVGALIRIDGDGTTDASFSVSDIMTAGTSVEGQDELPDAFQLFQNYPNPFNPSTSISYEIPVASEVTLKVYTLTGKEVVTLVQSTQEMGQHEVLFDARSLASGLYVYRIEAGAFTETRLMSLIK